MHSLFLLLFQYLSIYFITFDYQIGVSTKTPSLIQPTGANLPTPPLQPIDKANAGDRSAKGVPMPVQCSHWSRESETESYQSKPIPLYIFQMFGYGVVLPSIHFFFFNKTLSYWVLLKNKKTKNKKQNKTKTKTKTKWCPFMLDF